PGTARLRPKAATGVGGLVLAGSWTDTGWPDTMEGAVRSGLNAVLALRAQGTRGHIPAIVEPASTPALDVPSAQGTSGHVPGIVEDAVSQVTNAKPAGLRRQEGEVRS
ncbi:MAG TPA: FAD-dependent oxidoreductase, partial [Trebonia sp.]|nr:FAD-dependent oxidoreductase [Trebonia sp.]